MSRKQLNIQKLAMVEAYRASGLTAAKWCIENHVKLSNLKYWISRSNQLLKAEQSSPGFVEYQADALRYSAVSVYVNDFRIELNSGFEPQVFCKAIQLLSSL